jgi:ATP-binding protein involved in chromosome partitioning
MIFRKKDKTSVGADRDLASASETLNDFPSGAEVQRRTLALECSLTPELRRLCGEVGWAQRVLGAEVDGQTVRVLFLGDGLSLAEKVSFEEFIHAELSTRFPMVQRIAVVMKKAASLHSAGASAGDQSVEMPAGGAPGTPQQKVPRSAPVGGPAQSNLAGSRRAISGVKRILAVASGKGGVGKSTVSVNLAVALYNQGYRVGLLDADIYGPSVPTMLSLTEEPRVNEQNKIVPPERHGLKVMSFGFFAGEDAAVIWRGPMIMKALQQFFYDVDWGDLDFLVIDLPPGTGDAQLTLVQSLPVDGAVIVTTPQTVATLDAVKGVVMFQKTDVPVLGIVENMSTYHCPACGHESLIFGEGGAARVAEKYGIPLLGSIPLQSSIREAGDAGMPLTYQDGHPVRIRFAEIAEKVVGAVLQAQTKREPVKKSPLLNL